jgi:hypothetical protein
MCLPGQPLSAAPVSVPATAADAVVMAHTALAWLADADPTILTTSEQAETLRGLGRLEAVHTAAHASVVSAFATDRGYQDDGQGSAKTWLRCQTRITDGAATGAMGWMRRLARHPLVRGALADAEISPYWAKQICQWSDRLPADTPDDADSILLGAARGGADLEDIGGLAEELCRQCAVPDADRDDDGFDDRQVRLETTFAGAGKLDGDLTPACAAALGAVLDALGKPAGPEDLRTTWQRRHDALEEACRRLIAAGCLPDRAGQATQILLHMDLDRLRGMPGAADAEAARPGPAAPPGAECDATIVPVVTGHADPVILDQLAAALLRGGWHPATGAGQPGTNQPGASQPGAGNPGASHPGAGLADLAGQTTAEQTTGRGEDTSEARAARRELARAAARRIVLAAAADVLSGPAGLAAYLRTGLLGGPAAAISLPLDTRTATDSIPAHLRRLVIARDRHCRFPGCRQRPAACHPHHIRPRSKGGRTSLTNMLLLCAFHHLIAVHRWGWEIVLNPDGTVIATSPDRTRVLHSHSPPARAA